MLPADVRSLREVLHPIEAPPDGGAWNLEELDGLLPDAATALEAAVLVGLVPRDAGPSVILTRRNERMRQHAGQVSFPGGRIEPRDAGPLDAAFREAREEIGLQRSQASALGWLDPLQSVSGYRILPVIAEVSPEFRAVPDPGEVAEVFEVPLAFLLTPASLRRIDIEFRGRTRHVLEFLPHGDASQQRIWGVTASILFNLRQRLEALR